jgi:hypothetical protein
MTDAQDEQAQPSQDVDELPVIRRRSRAMFAARPQDPKDIDVVVSRGILSARSAKKPGTSRHRKIAGNLPAWEPLPPGELVVRRTSSG